MNSQALKLLELLDNIYSPSKRHLASFNNFKFKKIEELLSVFILERLVGNLNSVKILLSEVESNPNVEPSIGLLLRNNLSLCKIVFKRDELLNSQSDMKDFYKNVFGSNIQWSINYIKRNHSSSEVQVVLDKLKKGYAFILKQTGLDLDLIHTEKFHSTFSLSNKFSTLENLYVAYSKYEHFGLNTIILQENDDTEKLLRMNIAIHYSLQGILVCLDLLGIKDTDLLDLNKLLGEEAK